MGATSSRKRDLKNIRESFTGRFGLCGAAKNTNDILETFFNCFNREFGKYVISDKLFYRIIYKLKGGGACV
jgi:hypothetical protein